MALRPHVALLVVASACSAPAPEPRAPAAPHPPALTATRETGTPVVSASPVEPEMPAPSPSEPRRVGPLEPAIREALAQVRPDPPPRTITRNRHYFTSNENQHHLFRDAIHDVGGMQIGVGAEQNYLYAGWARPELLVLLDFDEWIVDLNLVYGVFFEHAATAEELVDLWSYARRKDALALLAERWPEEKDRWRKVRAYGEGGAEVHARLKKLRERDGRRGVASFLSDPEQYEWIAALWKHGRVLSVRGDLTRDRAMADVAAVAHKAAVPVRVLYLSNAEDYFDYGSGHFARNVLALPFDEKSVVLHTKPYDGDYYRFIYQSGANFQAWLESGTVATWKELAASAVRVNGGEDTEDLLTITALPEP